MRSLILLAVLSTFTVLVSTQPSAADCYGGACYSPCYSYVDTCWDSPWIPGVIEEHPLNGFEEIHPLDDENDEEHPLGSYYRNGTNRTWLYGTSPKLVIGTLQGMEDGNVRIAKSKGGVATIPMQQLSSIDQKIVATRLAAGNRTWTDRSRRYQRTAEFVRVDGRTVVLKTNAGEAINVAYAKLSLADQCVVKQLSGTTNLDELVVPPNSNLAAR